MLLTQSQNNAFSITEIKLQNYWESQKNEINVLTHRKLFFDAGARD